MNGGEVHYSSNVNFTDELQTKKENLPDSNNIDICYLWFNSTMTGVKPAVHL